MLEEDKIKKRAHARDKYRNLPEDVKNKKKRI